MLSGRDANIGTRSLGPSGQSQYLQGSRNVLQYIYNSDVAIKERETRINLRKEVTEWVAQRIQVLLKFKTK